MPLQKTIPSKREAFVALLAEGATSLHLDARRPGVKVPEGFAGEPHLILQYGYDLPVPIPDLVVDEDGVSATLSFSRSGQPTFVPWSAVYAVAGVDGRGVLYAEDVPKEIAVATVPDEARPRATPARALRPADAADSPKAPPPRVTPTLRAVSMDEPFAAAPATPVAPARRRVSRPQLRIVK